MDASFWHSRWEAGQIGFHQAEINLHLRDFWGQLNIPAGATVFVPLCGKSLDMLWLLEQGYRVLGVEISPLAVAAFFAENQLTPTQRRQGAFTLWQQDELRILQGDFFALQTADLDAVAAVYDRASLIALPPPMRARYAAHLQALLGAEIPILLIALDYLQAEMQGPPFAVTREEIQTLYGPAYAMEILREADILAESPGFQQRLSRLYETVYRLDKTHSE